MTIRESEILDSPRSRLLSSSSQTRPSPAEISLDAIGDILQRHENIHRQKRSDSHTDSDDSNPVDTDISVDSNAQLIAEIAAIVRSYQGGKTFPRSGIAGEDAEEINLEGGPNAVAAPITRVSNTDPDELNKTQLAQLNHPEILADDHLESSAVFAKEMLAADRRKRRKQRYTKVQVLLISWEEDQDETDLEAKRLDGLIENEIQEVRSLFEEDLRFSVERYAIPLVDRKGNDVNWGRKLLMKVMNFVDLHEDPETLLIFYYNGHGSFQVNSCYWHPSKAASEIRSGYRRPDDVQFYGPSLEWNSIQNKVSTTSDVLFILDCCYSGAALLEDSSKSRMPTTQILTACSNTQKTPAGPKSFSMKFVKAVKDFLAAGKTKIPIIELYGILVRTCTPQPLHLPRGPGNIVLEKLMDPNTLEKDHFLHPQFPRSRGSSFSSAVDGQVFSKVPSGGGGIEDSSSVSSTTSLFVTLSFRVKEDITPIAANWEHMLDAMPASEAAELASVEVHVEAAIPTGSTLLIVTIPMSHWLLLSPNPAYTFLGIVKGHNKLLPDTKTLKEQGLTGSLDLKVHDDAEADVKRQLVEAMLSFFQNISPSSPINLKSREPGRFRHMATKIGILPQNQHKESRSLEDDPQFITISQLVQKLLVVRDEHGEYEGYSYDLNFTVQRLFEETKRCVKESIRKGGEEGVLEERVTTEFDLLERELLVKLKEEGVRKASTIGSNPESLREKGALIGKKGRDDGGEDTPPKDGPMGPRGSTYFNSRSSLLRHRRGLGDLKGVGR